MFRATILFVTLCSPPGARAQIPPDHPEIVRIPAAHLQLPADAAVADFRVLVRGASQADARVLERLREETRSMVGGALGTSTLALVEAFALPGFFSGSLIAGAVFIAPLAVTIGVMEKRQRETIQRVLQERSLIERVDEGMQRWKQAAAQPEPGTPTLEVVILGYGLTRDPVCLFADVALRLTVDGRGVFEDMIYIEPFVRSADAPPPVCRTVEAFAKDDGRLIRNGLIEYGQVIPAIVIRRTRALPWHR